MTKIFITGCAKSGTTMLLDMFHAFESTYVISDEVTLSDFCSLTPERVGSFDFVVGKRSVGTLFSSSTLTERDIAQHGYLIAKHDIRIVNIVRDGRNVVRSYVNSWGYYNPFEWMECILQTQYRPDLIELQVKYEDLLSDPNGVQSQLEAAFAFNRIADFADYPKFVANDNRKVSAHSYNLRPIDATKIQPDKTSYLRRPNDVEYFNQLLTGLNYEV